jgi:membrane-associated protease RseP (regulator of RpoE activity)
MTRFTTNLLTALLMLGCGSGAMATPDRGQWTGYEPGYGPGYTTFSSQESPTTPSRTPGDPQSQDQGSWQDQQDPQSQQNQQNQQDPQNQQNQDDDEDQQQAEAQDHGATAGQPRLGVLVMGLTPELRRFFGVRPDRGVLIARVEPGSPAAKAGVQVGDVLVRVGRQQARSGEDVVQALTAQGGGRIRIAVIRQHQPVRLVAVLPGRPLSPQTPEQDQI